MHTGFVRLASYQRQRIRIAVVSQHLRSRSFARGVVGDFHLQGSTAFRGQFHYTGTPQKSGIFGHIGQQRFEGYLLFVDGNNSRERKFLQQKIGSRVSHYKLEISSGTSRRLDLLLQITLVVSREFNPGKNLLQLTVHGFAQQRL